MRTNWARSWKSCIKYFALLGAGKVHAKLRYPETLTKLDLLSSGTTFELFRAIQMLNNVGNEMKGISGDHPHIFYNWVSENVSS